MKVVDAQGHVLPLPINLGMLPVRLDPPSEIGVEGYGVKVYEVARFDSAADLRFLLSNPGIKVYHESPQDPAIDTNVRMLMAGIFDWAPDATKVIINLHAFGHICDQRDIIVIPQG